MIPVSLQSLNSSNSLSLRTSIELENGQNEQIELRNGRLWKVLTEPKSPSVLDRIRNVFSKKAPKEQRIIVKFLYEIRENDCEYPEAVKQFFGFRGPAQAASIRQLGFDKSDPNDIQRYAAEMLDDPVRNQIKQRAGHYYKMIPLANTPGKSYFIFFPGKDPDEAVCLECWTDQGQPFRDEDSFERFITTYSMMYDRFIDTQKDAGYKSVVIDVKNMSVRGYGSIDSRLMDKSTGTEIKIDDKNIWQEIKQVYDRGRVTESKASLSEINEPHLLPKRGRRRSSGDNTTSLFAPHRHTRHSLSNTYDLTTVNIKRHNDFSESDDDACSLDDDTDSLLDSHLVPGFYRDDIPYHRAIL